MNVEEFDFFAHAQIEYFLNGSEVRRYHGHRMIHYQTLAEHGAQSVFFVWLLYRMEEFEPPAHVMMAALMDDFAEQFTGDIPSPSKRQLSKEFLQELKNFEKNKKLEFDFSFALTDEEKRRLKLADYLSGLAHCLRERELGNVNVAVIFNNFLSYISEFVSDSKEQRENEKRLIQYFVQRWESANAAS